MNAYLSARRFVRDSTIHGDALKSAFSAVSYKSVPFGHGHHHYHHYHHHHHHHHHHTTITTTITIIRMAAK
jgi:hypothetical protein